MPVLSGILRPDPVSYTATLGTESVTVTFDRSRMTGRWERDIGEAIEKENGTTVAELILGVFIAWDVVDDDGAPVPINTEILLDLPNRALLALLEGMREAGTPSSAEGNGLSAPTSIPSTDYTAPATTPPNGLATSPSPVSSTSPSLT